MFTIHFTQLPWTTVLSLYPIVYVISIPLALAFKRYNSYIGELWFVQFLELYIVRKYMFHWFSVIYVANLVEYENGRVSFPLKDPWTVDAIKVYLCNLIWLTILLEWCFGSPIFERISVATGAYCTVPEIYREYQCEKSGGSWVNAFDSSSHYTMLISNSLLTWRLILPHITSVLPSYISRASVIVEGDIEAGSAQSSISIEDVTSRIGTSSSIFKKVAVLISLLFLTLWFISFCVTSVFYHTIPEKLVGLTCGMTIPLFSSYI
ncbi:hypothetical protein CORT_0D03740 [Candida orthopsilosis Co 90-125]|uniref:Uncharacterized protein n=1 Tax=Candida orthopsilosis (strain 90-125) TaxID=1136231 RepID=H8X5C1_CANO9|nr:hypothetical protein CORT_0D03740 [Candida orthopsilosis Co 90-125]CCG23214.1 hypothetical protein CORT_0D03740 [Candida orthopsilosis Co 90-125]